MTMRSDAHEYAARCVWEGNLGQGTSTYAGYSRRYRILTEGKPDLVGSADPAFRGETDAHNPEDLLVASLSACHMLTYLALCALSGITVASYTDEAQGTMITSAGGATGRFESVRLHPRVSIIEKDRETLAMELHTDAHAGCFIANSCNFPISVFPEVKCE
jgi:organic hydroperoxide reductase OsmC/OhrA